MTYRVVNATRKTTLGAEIVLANSSGERRTGLLKQDSLSEGHGLWIIPCEGIHTMFMRFAIDVVFLDRRNRVRKVRPNLQPWRLCVCIICRSVLELPAGTVARTLTAVGDEFVFERLK